MEEVLNDSRFSHVANDPRFRRIPKYERKVKIDKRFQSMFKDKDFKLKYTVDKRGRPTNYTAAEELKRYYELSSSDESSQDEDEEDEDTPSDIGSHEKINKQKKCKSSSRKVASGSDSDASDNTDDVVKRSKGVKSESALESKKSSVSKSYGESSCSKKHSRNVELGILESTHKNVFRVTELENNENEHVTDRVKSMLKDMSVDYARGEGMLFSDSSSEDESSSESEDEEIDHGWGELDRDAPITEDATCRLAACNMDWDRIKAADIMVLLNSFVPPGGVIHSVTVYPSEFGLKRLQEEEVSGPPELVEESCSEEEESDEEGNEDEAEEGSQYHMEKLRKYQLNRLKYFYAVIVCDSVDTANKIYTECDGLEYESSSTRLDLRFIPDDMSFDQEPREVCDQLPSLSKYEPKSFITTALQQTKVDLTWDETDPDRVHLTKKLMNGKGDVDDADIKAYLGSSSEEEEEEEEDTNTDDDVKSQGKETDAISKYKALLQEIEDKERKKKERDVEMEITFGVGMKEKTEKLVKKKIHEKQVVTPFEKMVEKKKEKTKLRKEKWKKKIQETEKTEDDMYSDDELPSDVDLDDPYFKEALGNEFKKKHAKKNKKDKTNNIEDDEDKQKKAELELLLMNDDDEKNHFNLKSLVEGEKKTKTKKKKRKMKAEGNKEDDTFQVDVKDPRFTALYSSHHYNIDPVDPHFHKTKGMEAIISEKLRRRNEESSEPSAKVRKVDEAASENKRRDPELSLLVKNVKNFVRINKRQRL